MTMHEHDMGLICVKVETPLVKLVLLSRITHVAIFENLQTFLEKIRCTPFMESRLTLIY